MKFKSIFKYYWSVARQYRLALFSVFFLGIGRILFSMIAAGYIYKNIIDTLNDISIPTDSRYQIVVFLLIGMGISFIISMFMSRWGDYVYFRFLAQAVKKINDLTFSKLINHSYNFFTNSFAGSLVTKVKRFSQSFEVSVDILFNTFWQIVVAVVLSFTALYFQSKTLAFYLLIWCFLYLILVTFFTRAKIPIDIKWAAADSRLTGFLADSITNILNIKIFSAYKKEFLAYQDVTQNYKDKSFTSYKYFIIRSAFQALFMVAFHIFILYQMLALWKMGEISVGVFVMTYVYILGVFDRIWELSHGINKFMKAMTDAKEMADILDKTPDILDLQNAEDLRINHGEIAFEKVSFSYVEDLDVFENFDFKVKAGEKVGLVGHSGSGKSTITKMLLRFTDVSAGVIKIDGQEIAKITQDDLRSKISYVPQDPILFHRSIKENIAYSKNNATDEEVIEAAKKAHAHEFISSLQHGYDTLVGERGVKLSGGERQRVAIARAMLKDAPILILDEATSSLDSISETYIQEAFIELMKGKTTIVIAHRLSTIQKMDRIVVLDKGKIIEEGTHKELLEKGGTYAELWNRQTGGFLE